MAGQWFGENERVIATTLAAAAQPLGVAVGYVFPLLFVVKSDADPGQENIDNAQNHKANLVFNDMGTP